MHCMADTLERGYLPSALHGGCTWAWVLTICEHVCTAWRMRLSVGSYHLRACVHCMADALERGYLPSASMCALHGGCTWAWVLTICEHVCTAWRMRLGVQRAKKCKNARAVYQPLAQTTTFLRIIQPGQPLKSSSCSNTSNVFYHWIEDSRLTYFMENFSEILIEHR